MPKAVLRHLTVKSVLRGKLHDGKFTYDCTVPTNTTATLKLPNGDIHTLAGGSYHFEINV